MPSGGWYERFRRAWLLWHVYQPEYRFLFDPPPPGEWVAIDCETTGLDRDRDQIIAIGAVRIAGSRVLTSQRLELLVRPERGPSAASVRVHMLRSRDLAGGMAPADAVHRLLEFVGPRPLVGYFLEFDVAMIDRELRPYFELGLPQPKFEVSSMYYEYRNRQLPVHLQGGEIDLRFRTMMDDLGLPLRPAHNALDDAVMAALAFVKLRKLLGRP